MKLFARRTSSNSQKVLWFLGELEIDYEFIATGGDAGGLDTLEYLALNPNGRVPTLVDGDLPIWESHTILRYLAATYGADTYWSEDAAWRSQVDRWMDWSQSQFDASFMALFWGYYRTPEAKRNTQANQRFAKQCQASILLLDSCLSDRDYLAGDHLSLADICIGALMYRYGNLDVTDALPPEVAKWYGRLCERKSFQSHVMLAFDELKGRLAP